MNKNYKLLIATFAAAFAALPLFAAIGTYWTGDAQDGIWETPENWETRTIPGTIDRRYFGANTNGIFTVNGNVNFGHIVFTEDANGNYTLNKNGATSKLSLYSVTVQASTNGATLHTFSGAVNEVAMQKGTRFTIESPATSFRITGASKLDWIGKEYTYKDGAGTFIYDHTSNMNVSQFFLSDGVVDCAANFNGFFCVENGAPGGTFTNSAPTRQCVLTLTTPNGAITNAMVDGMAFFTGNIGGNVRLVVGATSGNTPKQIFSGGSIVLTNSTTFNCGEVYFNTPNALLANTAVIGATGGEANAILGGDGRIAMLPNAALTVAHTGTRVSRAIIAPGGAATNIIDTMTIGTLGNNNVVTLGKQSVLRIKLTPDGASCLAINGDLVLENDPEIEFICTDAARARIISMPVITWTGTHNGARFATVTGLPEQYILRYRANAIIAERNDLGTFIIVK